MAPAELEAEEEEDEASGAEVLPPSPIFDKAPVIYDTIDRLVQGRSNLVKDFSFEVTSLREIS